jgi:hypothetical protein
MGPKTCFQCFSFCQYSLTTTDADLILKSQISAEKGKDMIRDVMFCSKVSEEASGCSLQLNPKSLGLKSKGHTPLGSHIFSSYFPKCQCFSSIHGYGHMCLLQVKPLDLTWYHLFFSKCHDSSSIHGYGHMCLLHVKPLDLTWYHLFFSKCHDSPSIHGYGHMCLLHVKKPLDLTWYHLIFLSVMILHPSMYMGTCVYIRWSLWRRMGLT